MSPADVPEFRAYRHVQCNTETVISGTAFQVASNPISDMTRTWCSQCESFFPISDYEWADTGENIADYYARHGARATSLERFLCSKKFLAIFAATGLVLGLIGGFILFRNDPLSRKLLMVPFVGGLGAFIAAGLQVLVLEKAITRRVCGTSDTRILK